MKLTNHMFILRKALPVIFANATVPLLGLAETAAIGQTGSASELGAIALGALVFSFVYWGFGFLRMGTTGFIAQALGAGDKMEIKAIFLRSWAMSLGIGLLLMLSQQAIGTMAMWLMDASGEVKVLVKEYFYIRIWGAPATLGSFAVLGTLIGLGHTRALLFVQLFLNGFNILLNLLFVLGFGWGVAGIALGTVIAEWLAFFFGLWIVMRSLRAIQPFSFDLDWASIFERAKFVKMLQVNTNIMLRTLALLSGFAWFANQGAKFGDVTLAANHVLLQFVSFSAFFLDGYAYVIEMMIGKAIGANDRNSFLRDMRHSSQLAGATALLLALLIGIFGSVAIDGLAQDNAVRAVAKQYLPYAAVYVLISFYAFQLDGVFIGATRSREMRNASIFSLILFIGSGLLIVPVLGNTGLWVVFIAYVAIRGLSLTLYMPRLRSDFDRSDHL